MKEKTHFILLARCFWKVMQETNYGN